MKRIILSALWEKGLLERPTLPGRRVRREFGGMYMLRPGPGTSPVSLELGPWGS